ncbi:MAG: UDP-N-acetylmuramoyl-L-alanyl-D-glutamate--2,6-diaminopimelate ligase [Gammaproteobacteria bacterium]|nr:UDP-N-acetylmuramoyl-L-alanyl-D-glutamate--2,6-diaminopimelate ligase [Gammaproteobacteria bacterium]
MMLSQLLADFISIDVSRDVNVSGVSEYSGDVESGDLFIASSGLQYVQDAINNGAVAIIYQSKAGAGSNNVNSPVPMFECFDLSEIVNKIISRFYGDINHDIKTVAITGTDGKSSVAHLVAQALEKSGHICGLIGTLGYGRLGNLQDANHTTPPVSRIAREYFRFNQMGCEAVAIEASSHGIEQKRLRNLSIHTAVLTNISRDHLDYHNSVEEYINAKAGLFFSHQAKHAVLNIDDQNGVQWAQSLADSLNVLTFSLVNAQADVFALDVKYLHDATMIRMSVKKKVIDVKVPLLGQFNVLNLLAVAAVLLSLDEDHIGIGNALNKLIAVPGRMQIVSGQHSASVIVDYAHTPAALFAALNAVREHCSGKIICVFGCGGNRDTGKRSQMGEMASRYADFTVITSDNPRDESRQEIIDQIVSGCIGLNNYKTVVDREQAIIDALNMASANDAVLIAGKGHEKFQYVKNQKIAFDDVVVATKELARLANG